LIKNYISFAGENNYVLFKQKVMCGIVGVFDLKVSHMDLKASVLKMSKKVRHRGLTGPDLFAACDSYYERLSIVDPQEKTAFTVRTEI
jgi:asparagine synthetase B (glutamine-hydrolysing)